MFAGGGRPGGAGIGSSDATAAEPRELPVGPEDIVATVYAALGIDLGLELRDGQGKPHALCTGRPMRGLVG